MKTQFAAIMLMSLVGVALETNAAPLTMTTTVKSVAVGFRSAVDWGYVRIAVSDPITGTACAASDTAKGFFSTSGLEPRSLPYIQLMQSQAAVSKAQDLKVQITYDTASTCYQGHGVGFSEITVLY